MTTTTVIRATEPRDLISYAIHAVGYRPRHSLVLLCLEADGRRIGMVARHDLPGDDDADVAGLAGFLAQLAAREEASGVLLVAFCDEEVAAAPLVTAVETELGHAGIAVRDVWHVAERSYRSLRCQDAGCCPAAGRPLDDVGASTVEAEMVLRGSTVSADRDGLVGDLSPIASDVVDAVGEVTRSQERRWWCPEPQLPRLRREALALWRSVLADPGPRPSDEACGILLAALQDPGARDAIMLTAVPGSGVAADRLAAGRAHTPGVTTALDAAFGAPRGRAVPTSPDPELAHRVDTLLRHLVRGAAEDHQRCAPLAVMAWLAWWRGSGARARELVDRALEADPGHSLAQLVRDALDHCLPPPWVSAPRERRRSGS